MARECWKPRKKPTQNRVHKIIQSGEKIDNPLRKREPRKRNKRITMIIVRIAGRHEITRKIIHENENSEKNLLNIYEFTN